MFETQSYYDRLGYPRQVPQSLRDRLTAPAGRTYRIDHDATKATAIALADTVLKDAGVKAEIKLRHPDWKPGDVVVVYYGPHRTPYTYVRGQAGWLVEAGREQKTDDFMNDLLDRDRLNPVLQAGGVPFEAGRL